MVTPSSAFIEVISCEQGGSGIIFRINHQQLTPEQLTLVLNAMCKKMVRTAKEMDELKKQIDELKRQKIDK